MLDNPLIFTVNLGLIGIIQSMGGSLLFSTMNTIEKRYAFDSKVSGLISIADNLSSMVVCCFPKVHLAGMLVLLYLQLSPLIGYYGIRFNRARLIGFGELIIALSFFTSALPYFIYGPATHLVEGESSALLSQLSATYRHNNSANFQMCSTNQSEDCADNRGSTVWPAVILLFIGNFIRGVGFTIFYVIALPFMDDNVSKKKSPIYLAALQCIMLIGPACGFFFSAFCLRLYEDPWSK